MVSRVHKTKPQAPTSGGAYYLASPQTSMSFIPSGSTLLDLALGGGWAEGRIANIVGDSSSGKTLLCIEAAANFAIRYPGSLIRYRETEAAFNPEYAETIGMPLGQVDFGTAPLETIEDFYTNLNATIEHALKSGKPELYICDSLDALSDKAELERGFGEPSYGSDKAKDLSRMFRKLPLAAMERSKVTLLIVSQIRDKIGVTFGRKWTRSGGKALQFYCSQIVFLAQTSVASKTLNGAKHTIGINIKARCEKNKAGQAFREAEFPIMFGYGIDDAASCCAYLDANGALKPVLGTMKDVAFLNAIRNRDKGWKILVDKLHGETAKHWYDTQRKLLPKFRKYDK
jgi:recombination protein RecA